MTLVLALAAAALGAHASLLAHSVTGTGSGSLDGTSFTDAAFVLTGLADTAEVASLSATVDAVRLFAPTVRVPGVGADIFTGDIRAVVNRSIAASGISDFTANRAILFASDPSFATYDLRSPIGPVGVPGAYNTGFSFATNNGGFVLSSVSSAKFAAAPVPEPAPLAALACGAVGLLRRRRRA